MLAGPASAPVRADVVLCRGDTDPTAGVRKFLGGCDYTLPRGRPRRSESPQPASTAARTRTQTITDDLPISPTADHDRSCRRLAPAADNAATTHDSTIAPDKPGGGPEVQH